MLPRRRLGLVNHAVEHDAVAFHLCAVHVQLKCHGLGGLPVRPLLLDEHLGGLGLVRDAQDQALGPGQTGIGIGMQGHADLAVFVDGDIERHIMVQTHVSLGRSDLRK